MNYMHFVAEELRNIMAQLGFRTVDEMVGQSQKLNMSDAIDHFKAKGIDLSSILHKPNVEKGTPERNVEKQDHKLENVLDFTLISQANKAIEKLEPQTLEFPIYNTNRSVGAILSNEISKKYGADGLPEDTMAIYFTGSAGQVKCLFSIILRL